MRSGGVKLRYEDVRRLYDDHGPALLAYACCLLGDRSGAEDVLHQVFLKLLRASLPDDARPYLFRAVRNAALNARRYRSRHVAIEPDHEWFEGPTAGSVTGITLQTALGNLPGEQREVLGLRIWGGLTFQEIAALLEIPLNTAGSRYRYAIAALRRHICPKDLEQVLSP
jgi:RNA polymerase sigma-70 factor, ECF subfamily